MKRNTIPNCIQTAILITLAVTCILNFWNISQQKTYIGKQDDHYKNILRPWVYPKISDVIEIEDGYYKMNMTFTNTGKTPAYRVYEKAIISDDSEFPEDSFPYGFGPCMTLFPNQINSTTLIKYLANNKSIKNQETRKLVMASTIFLHIYCEYEDFNENIYALRISFFIANKKPFESNIRAISQMFSSSQEGIEGFEYTGSGKSRYK